MRLCCVVLLQAIVAWSTLPLSRSDVCASKTQETCWGLDLPELASELRASPFPALYKELVVSEAECSAQSTQAGCESQGSKSSRRCRWYRERGCAAWNSVASFQLQARACTKSPSSFSATMDGALGSLDLEAVTAAECQSLSGQQDCQAAVEGVCIWRATTAGPATQTGSCALGAWPVAELEERLSIGSCAFIPSAEVAFSQYIALTDKCGALTSSGACQRHAGCVWSEARGWCAASLSVLAGPLAQAGVPLAKDIRACEQRGCEPQQPAAPATSASTTSAATQPISRIACSVYSLLLALGAGLVPMMGA